jgi:hypothetical protein
MVAKGKRTKAVQSVIAAWEALPADVYTAYGQRIESIKAHPDHPNSVIITTPHQPKHDPIILVMPAEIPGNSPLDTVAIYLSRA